MEYLYVKSLHLIFIITWFAGLFYIPRLFVYHIEASEKPEPEKSIIVNQLKMMTKRLWYIITWPSAVLAVIFGVSLLVLNSGLLYVPWMQIKLGFVVLLILYHIKCHQIFIQFQKGFINWSSNQMRLWNEGATIILFSVIFLVILKNAFSWIFGVIGIIVLSILLMLGFKFYKRIRAKNKDA